MNRTFASFAPHALYCPIRPVLLHAPCFAPYALKGQKLLAQGIALGNYGRKLVALKGQKL